MRASLTVAALTLALVTSSPAAADEVHLANGKSFENVVAHVRGDEVTVRLPGGGEIILPRNQVVRVDRSRTPLEIFGERESALRHEPSAGATEWLRLAEWAREHGLAVGRRRAALTAARLAPEDPAVKAEMRLLGYTLDPEAGEWVTVPEAMLRRGLVAHDGRWVTPDAREREIQLAHEAARDRARDERLDRMTRAIEATTELELARSLAQTRRPEPVAPQLAAQPAVVYTPAYPVYVVSGYFPLPPAPAPQPGPDAGGDMSPAPAPAPAPPITHRSSYGRYVPGSLSTDPALIPGRLDPGPVGTSGRRR